MVWSDKYVEQLAEGCVAAGVVMHEVGGLHAVSVALAVAFFDDVSKLNRIVNIDNIDFRNPRVAGDQVTMDISNLATTYRFLDETERKKAAQDKAKAAKK